MYNGATETIQNFTPPMLTISSDRSLGERWSCGFVRVSLVRPIARDIRNPRMKMRRAQTAAPRGGACVAHHPRDPTRRPESGIPRNGADTFKLLHPNEARPPDRGGGGRVRPVEVCRVKRAPWHRQCTPSRTPR